jgi:2-methylcitrate dehydratase PrpD
LQISIPNMEPVMRLPPVPDWLSQWAEFAATVCFADLDTTVVSRSKRVLYDCIAAIAAGAQEPEIGRLTERLVALGGTGGALTPAIGGHTRLPAPMAVLVNGTAGTVLELDEGNQYCRGHPGIHVVPAALATAERRGTSGRDLLLAIALGYEIGARVGIASKLRVTMHPHGTWGTVGAAVAVAKLHGADAGRMRETINVASTLGLGTSRRTMLEGGTVRNSFAGWSNQLGLIVWEMVEAGFTGEVDGIGTIYGTVLADDFRPEEMVAELGARWEIARNYFKRHACCRYNHGALDALGRIMSAEAGRLDPDAIASIDVATYVWAAQLAGQEPHNMLAAKFSLPFSIATFVVNGAATVAAFGDKARADATIRDLARRVFVTEDKALTAGLPGLRPARVTVRLTDGRVLSDESLTNRGDTEDPYSETEIRAKFIELTASVWGRTRAKAVLQACETIDNAETIGDLMEMLAG